MKTKKNPNVNIKQMTGIVTLTSLILVGYLLGANKGSLVTFFTDRIPFISRSTADAVTSSDLARMMKNKGFTLINVHTPYDGEIAQTDTFIPYDQIVAQSASLPKDKNAPIILYCRSGNMSAQALKTIRSMGYTNVRHLSGGMDAWRARGQQTMNLSTLDQDVTPDSGIELPITWADLPGKLVENGVIDFQKFKEVVKLTSDQEALFRLASNKKIRIDKTNSQFIVDMLWAIGLAQKSKVYDEGPLGREYKDQAANFSSTGGWTLAKGPAMNYLNRFDLIPLTALQQQKVADIAKNVYRPCCGASAWFPDCNHGMAALAAIEMMVASGVDDKTIYRKVLALNSYWFSQSYVTIATYFARQGIPWDKVDAKLALSDQYSSAKGANETAKKVGPIPYGQTPGGGGCGA